MLSVIHRCCCGLDVHKDTVVACLLQVTAEGEVRQETRTFPTILRDLEALGGWLRTEGCTHVAMESTGVFVRRITARAIPPAGRAGSEENPRVND